MFGRAGSEWLRALDVLFEIVAIFKLEEVIKKLSDIAFGIKTPKLGHPPKRSLLANKRRFLG